jgi:hypothetical protein
MQYKALSDRTSMPVYIATRARDLHELAYAWLIVGKFCIPREYGGTYLNVIRKISAKAIKERPDSAFVQELIPISWLQVNDAIEDIQQIADDMEDIMNGVRPLVDNREADTNRYGNVMSPYHEVLYNRASIDDNNLFMDAPPDPYDIAEE